MARKSYDRMYREYDVKEYDNKRDNKVEEKKEEVVPEPVIEEKKEEDVKEESKPSFTGTVIGGASLNVRRNPNGDVITSIANGSQVVIVDDSNPDWYKIESPVNGFVMKKFIKA